MVLREYLIIFQTIVSKIRYALDTVTVNIWMDLIWHLFKEYV